MAFGPPLLVSRFKLRIVYELVASLGSLLSRLLSTDIPIDDEDEIIQPTDFPVIVVVFVFVVIFVNIFFLPKSLNG